MVSSVVRRIVAASGREPDVVRGHVVAMPSVRAVVVVSSGVLVVSAGVVTTVVGSTAVVVIVVVVGRRVVVRCVVVRRVVVGAVNNRSYIWYQVEMEEETIQIYLGSIHFCLFLPPLVGPLAWTTVMPMKSGFLASSLGLSNLFFTY